MQSEPYASRDRVAEGGLRPRRPTASSTGSTTVDRVGPLTMDRFLAYADWYTEQLVPDVEDRHGDRPQPGRRRVPGDLRGRRPDHRPAGPGGHRRDSLRPAPRRAGRPARRTWSRTPPTTTTWTASAAAASRWSAAASPRWRRRRCCTRPAPTSRSWSAARRSAGWMPNPQQLSLIGHVRRPVMQAVRGLALRRSGTPPTAFRRLPQGHADHQGADRARARGRLVAEGADRGHGRRADRAPGAWRRRPAAAACGWSLTAPSAPPWTSTT